MVIGAGDGFVSRGEDFGGCEVLDKAVAVPGEVVLDVFALRAVAEKCLRPILVGKIVC